MIMVTILSTQWKDSAVGEGWEEVCKSTPRSSCRCSVLKWAAEGVEAGLEAGCREVDEEEHHKDSQADSVSNDKMQKTTSPSSTSQMKNPASSSIPQQANLTTGKTACSDKTPILGTGSQMASSGGSGAWAWGSCS